MKLFEITIKGTKTFYIEAETQESALDHEMVHIEMTSSMGEFEWEGHEGNAAECSERGVEYANKHESHIIIQASKKTSKS